MATKVDDLRALTQSTLDKREHNVEKLAKSALQKVYDVCTAAAKEGKWYSPFAVYQLAEWCGPSGISTSDLADILRSQGFFISIVDGKWCLSWKLPD